MEQSVQVQVLLCAPTFLRNFEVLRSDPHNPAHENPESEQGEEMKPPKKWPGPKWTSEDTLHGPCSFGSGFKLRTNLRASLEAPDARRFN